MGKGDLGPTLEAAVWDKTRGFVTEPIRTDADSGGFEILRVNEHQRAQGCGIVRAKYSKTCKISCSSRAIRRPFEPISSSCASRRSWSSSPPIRIPEPPPTRTRPGSIRHNSNRRRSGRRSFLRMSHRETHLEDHPDPRHLCREHRFIFLALSNLRTQMGTKRIENLVVNGGRISGAIPVWKKVRTASAVSVSLSRPPGPDVEFQHRLSRLAARKHGRTTSVRRLPTHCETSTDRDQSRRSAPALPPQRPCDRHRRPRRYALRNPGIASPGNPATESPARARVLHHGILIADAHPSPAEPAASSCRRSRSPLPPAETSALHRWRRSGSRCPAAPGWMRCSPSCPGSATAAPANPVPPTGRRAAWLGSRDGNRPCARGAELRPQRLSAAWFATFSLQHDRVDGGGRAVDHRRRLAVEQSACAPSRLVATLRRAVQREQMLVEMAPAPNPSMVRISPGATAARDLRSCDARSRPGTEARGAGGGDGCHRHDFWSGSRR